MGDFKLIYLFILVCFIIYIKRSIFYSRISFIKLGEYWELKSCLRSDGLSVLVSLPPVIEAAFIVSSKCCSTCLWIKIIELA